MADSLAELVHDLLVGRVAGSAARPVLVHRDEALGSRVELSAISLANTVAKASSLFSSAKPGGGVRLGVPTHWLVGALALGAWHAGHEVVVSDQPAPATSVAVVGPDAGASGSAEQTYISRLHPLGLPFDDEPSWPLADLAPALREGPDELPPPAAPSADPEARQRENALVAAARTWTAALGARPVLLSAHPAHRTRGLLAITLVPLLDDGSTVLVTGTADPGRLAELAAEERATVVWAPN